MKEYCPYDLSVKLCEAGFDRPCLACYNTDFCTDGTPVKVVSSSHKPKEGPMKWRNSELFGNGNVSAPTFASAERWLREDKGFDIEVRIWFVGDEREYRPYILPPGCNDFVAFPPEKTPEEAHFSAIREILGVLGLVTDNTSTQKQ